MATDQDQKEGKPKKLVFLSAVVALLVLIVVGFFAVRMFVRAPAPSTETAAQDPSAFAETEPMDPDPFMPSTACEDPVTRCANNCKVEPLHIGDCEWPLVGGSTRTPEDALKTFATNLEEIQKLPEGTGDRAYYFDQFLSFYKKNMRPVEREAFERMRSGSPSPSEAKIIEMLLKKD